MLRIYALFFSIFAFSCNFLTAQIEQHINILAPKLANYLGTGSHPRLQLVLSANGLNWGSYIVDYQGIGNVPWSANPAINWSTWNVQDTNSPPNYYGTISLASDGTKVQWVNYVGGSGGYYLDGINFSYNTRISAYQLTVQTIHTPGGGGGGSGPFPNAPLATPAVYPGTTEPIIFRVRGDQIINDKEEPILLKGIVRPSLEWSPTGQYLSTQDLSNIANWKSNRTIAKSNVIRLDLYQGYWLSSGPVTQMGSYKQIINAIVYYSIQLGMAVILDLHWTQSGSQSPMANQDSIIFWQQVATDYQSFGTVLFELFNEPYGITTDVWLNGNSTYAGYQQLYHAVRSVGAKNICIVGGLDYAYDLSFVNPSFKVNGENIVYCSHPYNQKGQPGYQGEGGTFQQNYQGILGHFPLIFTEFGTNSASYYPNGYDQIYSSILQFANANHVHYSGFAWWVQDGDPQFPCLIQDWEGKALYGGMNIHDDIAKNPGTPFAGSPEAFTSFKANLNPAGTPTLLDASKFGSGSFCWNFGDASSLCSPDPMTPHVYSRPGSYVIQLAFLQDGKLQFTSKTIKLNSIDPPAVVCPPKDLQGKQTSKTNKSVTNVITWQASKSESDCSSPVYYLVYRDRNLTRFIAEVKTPNGNGIYKLKDKVKQKGKITYAVVSVDQDGNRSLPAIVKIGNRRLINN